MNIDLANLHKYHWFEDGEGNEVEMDDPNARIYRHCFPCTLAEHMDSYDYQPRNPILKRLCRVKAFYELIRKGKDKTFRPMATFNSSCGSAWSQKCIVAMVNSGDYTLEEAIWVFTKSCERCMNVLLYRYLDGADGYEEYSEEWKRCNTVCDFCREEDTKNV